MSIASVEEVRMNILYLKFSAPSSQFLALIRLQNPYQLGFCIAPLHYIFFQTTITSFIYYLLYYYFHLLLLNSNSLFTDFKLDAILQNIYSNSFIFEISWDAIFPELSPSFFQRLPLDDIFSNDLFF